VLLRIASSLLQSAMTQKVPDEEWNAMQRRSNPYPMEDRTEEKYKSLTILFCQQFIKVLKTSCKAFLKAHFNDLFEICYRGEGDLNFYSCT
jgi:hypothetical protein